MIWTLDWYPLMNTSLHTGQNLDDKSIRFQSDSFVLLTTWKHVISSCKVYSISTIRMLTWDGTEFYDFILIASIHLWNQYTENFMSSSPLRCDFVTSLILRTIRSLSVEWKSELPQLSSVPRYFFQSRSHFFGTFFWEQEPVTVSSSTHKTAFTGQILGNSDENVLSTNNLRFEIRYHWLLPFLTSR